MVRIAAIILVLGRCMPVIGAAVMSELFRRPLEDRRVSIGLLPGPKGRVFAVATLRY